MIDLKFNLRLPDRLWYHKVCGNCEKNTVFRCTFKSCKSICTEGGHFNHAKYYR